MISTNPIQTLIQAISQTVQNFFDKRLKGIFDQLKELKMKMETVLHAVNHAAENQEKELTLLMEIKASNDALRVQLEAALNSDDVSSELEAAIDHLDAENDKVDERIAELSGSGQGGGAGTSGDGTGSGSTAPSGGDNAPGTGTSEPAGPAEPASEPPTSGTL